MAQSDGTSLPLFKEPTYEYLTLDFSAFESQTYVSLQSQPDSYRSLDNSTTAWKQILADGWRLMAVKGDQVIFERLAPTLP